MHTPEKKPVCLSPEYFEADRNSLPHESELNSCHGVCNCIDIEVQALFGFLQLIAADSTFLLLTLVLRANSKLLHDPRNLRVQHLFLGASSTDFDFQKKAIWYDAKNGFLLNYQSENAK